MVQIWEDDMGYQSDNEPLMDIAKLRCEFGYEPANASILTVCKPVIQTCENKDYENNCAAGPNRYRYIYDGESEIIFKNHYCHRCSNVSHITLRTVQHVLLGKPAYIMSLTILFDMTQQSQYEILAMLNQTELNGTYSAANPCFTMPNLIYDPDTNTCVWKDDLSLKSNRY
jgi:hypothetical protein